MERAPRPPPEPPACGWHAPCGGTAKGPVVSPRQPHHTAQGHPTLSHTPSCHQLMSPQAPVLSLSHFQVCPVPRLRPWAREEGGCSRPLGTCHQLGSCLWGWDTAQKSLPPGVTWFTGTPLLGDTVQSPWGSPGAAKTGACQGTEVAGHAEDNVLWRAAGCFVALPAQALLLPVTLSYFQRPGSCCCIIPCALIPAQTPS